MSDFCADNPNILGDEVWPPPGTRREAITEFVVKNAVCDFHACGSCKMGDTNNKYSVVDKDLSVIGVRNLKIADASIIPEIMSGNINAPSMLIGRKAADIIEKVTRA